MVLNSFVIICNSSRIVAQKSVRNEIERILYSNEKIIKKQKIILILIIITFILYIAFYIVNYYHSLFYTNVVSVLLCIAFIFTFIFFKNYESFIRRINKEEYSSKVQNIVKQAEKDGESMDALAYMIINLNNIEKYYIWSQKQAKYYLIFAVILIITGLLFIIASTICNIFFKLDYIVVVIGTICDY